MSGTPVERVRALLAEVVAEIAAIPVPVQRAHALQEVVALLHRVEPALCLLRDQAIRADTAMVGRRTTGRPRTSLGSAAQAAEYIGCTPAVIANARCKEKPFPRYRGAALALIELRTGRPPEGDSV